MRRLHRHTVPVPGVYRRTGRRNSSCSTGCSLLFGCQSFCITKRPSEALSHVNSPSLYVNNP